MTPSTRTHLTAVRDALPGTVHLGDVPSSARAPYTFLTYAGGGVLDGPVAAPDDDGELVVQATYVGSGVEQAEWYRDRGRQTLLGNGTVTVSGRRVWRVALDTSQPSLRDNNVEPPVFYAIDRYRIFSTEAT